MGGARLYPLTSGLEPGSERPAVRAKAGGAPPQQRLLALQRALGNRAFRSALLMRECACDGSGRRGAELFEARTGVSRCDVAKGKVEPENFNKTCTRPCTDRHEAKHVEDASSCCAEAGRALAAAPDDAAKKQIEAAIKKWMQSDNEAYLECRAYTEGLKCLDEMFEKRKCRQKKEDDCCAVIGAIWGSWLRRKEEHCGKPGAGRLTQCPFPLPVKQGADPEDPGALPWGDLFGDLPWGDLFGDQVEPGGPGDEPEVQPGGGVSGSEPGGGVSGSEPGGGEPEDDLFGGEPIF